MQVTSEHVFIKDSVLETSKMINTFDEASQLVVN